jgi:hypothetical protein
VTTSLEAPNDRREARAAVLDAVGSDAPALQWQEVEQGFWVANSGGNFGGTVEEAGRRYWARDAMGTILDVVADAASARGRVAERYAQLLTAADSWE